MELDDHNRIFVLTAIDQSSALVSGTEFSYLYLYSMQLYLE